MAEPSPYAELIDLIENLPVLVRETRRRRGLSERAAAEAAGVPFTTISRAENGHALHTDSILALLRFVADMRQHDRAPRPSQRKAPRSALQQPQGAPSPARVASRDAGEAQEATEPEETHRA